MSPCRPPPRWSCFLASSAQESRRCCHPPRSHTPSEASWSSPFPSSPFQYVHSPLVLFPFLFLFLFLFLFPFLCHLFLSASSFALLFPFLSLFLFLFLSRSLR